MVESHPNLLTGIGAQVDGVLTPVVIAVVVAETHRGVIAATVGRAAPNHREVAGGRVVGSGHADLEIVGIAVGAIVDKKIQV